MSAASVTIREQIREALIAARPQGLTMPAIAGVVAGPWRTRDVEAVVRKLWEVNELARRSDGTFVVIADRAGAKPERVVCARRRLDAAVKRVADAGRREGYSAKIAVRWVDPGLLQAWCPGCRRVVHPRLDGTCVACGLQTGANQEPPAKPRRRRRRKPLREGQPGFGPVCRCGGWKSKQAHLCRDCSAKRRRGRKLAVPGEDRRRQSKRISDELLLEARRLYATGLSMRQVAARLHPQTSYMTVASCAEGLYGLFGTRGWKLRPQKEVTRARSTKHGRKRRAQTREQQNAYRRWLASQRGWQAIQGPGRPICKGVRRQPPGKGKPCEHHALQDSEYCYSHDPRFELERQAATARMRARAAYREPVLPAAPFTAWLEQLRTELGGWRQVAELIGADPSAAHRWGTGQTRTVAVRVARRSAENAGTTLEAIYPNTPETSDSLEAVA